MEDFFYSWEYTVSSGTLKRIEFLCEAIKEGIQDYDDPGWKDITVKNYEETYPSSPESMHSDKENVLEVTEDKSSQSLDHPSTQFYFTQIEKKCTDQKSISPLLKKYDIVESLYEGLECANGRLDLSQFENLSDQDLIEIINDLEPRISSIGLCNLCSSMISMSLDERIRYTATLYSHVLLPKILGSNKPSRMLCSAIVKCMENFPDDFQKLIFVPLLTHDINDSTLIVTIAKAFGPQRKCSLAKEFLEHVQDLKPWHISILESLLTFKLESSTTNQIVHLLCDNALPYARDKSFGKLVLSAVKAVDCFTAEQKTLLWEVVNLHDTLFKRAIENILKTL